MDDPALDSAEHRRALDGLSRINRLSRTVADLWKPIEAHAIAAGRAVRVLDLACGGGDVTVGLRQRAIRAGLPIRVNGCDLSGVAINRSRELARREQADCDFFALDAVREPLPDGYDAIVSSLFLHHLTDEQAMDLLRRSASAAALVVMSDLVRSGPAWVATWLGTRVISRSGVVHDDGPSSVAAAFTVAEMRRLLERARLEGATVTPTWPMRMLITRRERARDTVAEHATRPKEQAA